MYSNSKKRRLRRQRAKHRRHARSGIYIILPAAPSIVRSEMAFDEDATEKLFYVSEERNSNNVTLYWSNGDINQEVGDINQEVGDDWNDAPYEHNAGSPRHYSSCFNFNLHNHFPGITFPRNHDGEVANSRYSIEMINGGLVPWLKFENYALYAGATIQEFFNFLYTPAAITIQKAFRGFLGRRIATELRYRPDGIGFLEAKADFESKQHLTT